ncbi:MAG: excinuclease ABC subunit UvrC [Chitinivibrionales bacterium]|nr:excinuclease ABC subunit UvrC [Chitinivibrionales bacterium]
MVHFAKKIFRLRDCRKRLPLKRPVRPCLNYSMKRCSGACGGKISREAYNENIQMLIKFLQGKRKDLIASLNEQMEQASALLEFEQAALLRDQIRLIKDASRLQQVDLRLPESDADVFGWYATEKYVCLTVLAFREGLLLGKEHFIVNKQQWDFEESNLDSLVVRYYLRTSREPPSELILPQSLPIEKEMLSTWLGEHFKRPIGIVIPQRGIKLHLIDLAQKNGKLYLEIHRPMQAIESVQALKKVCCLPNMPSRIEAFDISNMGSSFAVAGMISFRDGVPDKSNYRRYKIKSVENQNDFAMMIEAVKRRLDRLRRENKPFPDLLLIDGGKGQLSAVLKPLYEFENPPMVISLAKKEEILYSPYCNNPVRLPQNHSARKLAERIRDEVHRYTVTYHRKLRGKQFKGSSLESLEGIGPGKAKLLLRRFGSIARLKEAPVGEIAQVKGFSEESAQKLKSML